MPSCSKTPWVSRLSLKLQPATVGVAHSLLAGVFKAAVRDRMIPASPCATTRLPKVERRQVDPLSAELVLALVDALPGDTGRRRSSPPGPDCARVSASD